MASTWTDGISLARRRALERFGGLEPLARGEIVGTLAAGSATAASTFGQLRRRIGHTIGQREHLPERQANGARELQLVTFELGFRPDHALALGRLLDVARTTSMPAMRPLALRSLAWRNSACAVSSCARAASRRLALVTASR